MVCLEQPFEEGLFHHHTGHAVDDERHADTQPSPPSSCSWRCSNSPLFFAVGLVSIAIAALGLGVRFGLPGIVYFLLGPLCYLQAVWSQRSQPGAAT